jgi:hypothetical protein
MNLILKKRTDNVLFGKVYNSNDLEYYMRCVEHDDDKRNKQFISITSS